MQRVVFAVSPFTEELEILGVDGEIYHIRPGEVVILPKLNAEIFEKHGVGKVVGDYEAEFDWEEYFERFILGDTNLSDQIVEEDPVKEWAKFALKVELSKPNPDPDRVIELKMVLNGKNPLQFYKSVGIKNAPQPAPNPVSNACPTGLSRPIYNTAQVHNSDSFIKEEDEINITDLELMLYTFGLSKKATLKVKRVSGLNELDLSGYSVLDYGFTRVEVHPEFRKLMVYLGYDEKDYRASVLFGHYVCEKHGDVFKPVLDSEVRGYLDEHGNRKTNYVPLAGRRHPLKKQSDVKRYSHLKFEQFVAIAEAVRKKGLKSFREFDGELKEVSQKKSDLALMWFVFTIPDQISRDLVKETPKKAEKIMREAVKSTIKRFLRKYLKKHEKVPWTGEFKFGGVMNVHLNKTASPNEAHCHVHFALWNFVIWNGHYVRFAPYLPENWKDELRYLWKREFFRQIRKQGYGAYYDELHCRLWEETYEFFNFYMRYTWFNEENYGRIIHHLRYNARKALIDINEFFYEGHKFEDLSEEEIEWLGFLLEYSNRTSNVGFMNNWRENFGIPEERAREVIQRAKNKRKDFCPICKSELEFVGYVTLEEIAKRDKVLVLWWFNKTMHVEVWRKDVDYG
ncbi:TPA_asm: hypothetical protein GahPV1_gp04 [Geoglobus ahangari pleomorphic virus 1]|uniref:Uncharacterized protein n=2 Tax=root TaxID=1 RepID=A0A0F7DC88_9EURY|nr:hypothetical protein [Geoglobus ahangari]AKG92416.1 hypothetical protein GAH_00228 [Geoglobus ahangari]